MYRPFEVSGWIPYWRQATGTADTLPHLGALTEINPFVYTLKQDGTLMDNGELEKEPWITLRAAAKAQNVRFIPTIMSGDKELMHRILSNTQSRIALEDRIAALVKEKGFDGIDIDFEGKRADTKDYFSLFLKGLYQRMGDKWVMCTIETRTPFEDRYYGTQIPADAGIFANDLVEINKYCDRVRIMAYDQQGVDQKLAAEAAAKGEIYAPVGDTRWVEKVVNLMSQSISKNKMMIGVPTYGYGYDVTAYANKEYVYDILWTFNPGYAVPIAQQLGIVPARNAAGELYFTYTDTSVSTTSTSQVLPTSGSHAAAAALAIDAVVTPTNTNAKFRLLTWPDEESIAQKIALAKRLGVRGISVFKFDGGQDPDIWRVIETQAQSPAPTPSPTPTPGTPGAFTRTLTLNSVGEDVRLLQQILNRDVATRIAASGVGSPGQETNRFGALTLAAVKKFQVKYGIATAGQAGYGLVGPKTRAKLNELR